MNKGLRHSKVLQMVGVFPPLRPETHILFLSRRCEGHWVISSYSVWWFDDWNRLVQGPPFGILSGYARPLVAG